MQTAGEIKSAVDNIKYYAKEINRLAINQFNTDFALGVELGIKTGPGALRFDCLGTIAATSSWLLAYCQNIETNLVAAVSQDKLLQKPDEEKSYAKSW